MTITQKDLIGEIKDFPIEVVEKMIERQVEQGNPADVRVFQKSKTAYSPGFAWDETVEGWGFWNSVIVEKNFELFFEKYPKKEEDYWIAPEGRRMLVWDGDEKKAKEKIVIAKLPLKAAEQYIAVRVQDEYKFEKGEIYNTMSWKHAKPIPAKTKLSISSIAEKFGLSVDEIDFDR